MSTGKNGLNPSTDLVALLQLKSLFYLKTDLEGNYTFVNDAYAEAMGMDREAALGTSSINHVAEESRPAIIKAMETLFAKPTESVFVDLVKPYKNGIKGVSTWEFKGLFTEEALRRSQ